MKVLVAYASKYGSTKGIAERIGEGSRGRGLEVDVSECKDLGEASGCDAYVVGSAAYIGKWRNDARKFVQRNTEELDAHPVWLFSSGPVGTDTVDAERRDVPAVKDLLSAGDFRDWDAIDAWAASIADELGPQAGRS